MTDFLVRRFVKDYEKTDNADVRTSYGILSSIVGICCNILLFAAKLLIGVGMHSLAIMADAFNNLSDAVTSAFYCGKLVLACSTYDGGLFPPMKEFLEHLQTKGFRNRRIGLMENGSWAPAAARLMRAELEKMKELRLCETEVSLRGALNQTSEAQMDALVAELCAE